MSLINDYLTYVSPLKGSRIYHAFSILTVASAVLERRVWLDRGGLGPIFANLYTILVGPPATGKGFAILQARGLLDELVYPVGAIPVKIGPTKITQAALYKELHEAERSVTFPNRPPTRQSPLFVAPEELAVHMVDFGGGTLTNELIDFWDSKSLDYVTVKRIVTGGDQGITKLLNPSLTILGGSTDSFLQQAAKDKLVVSGLSSRMIFVVEPNRVDMQDNYVPTDQTERAALKATLLRMHAMRGAMRFSPDGQARYNEIAPQAREASWNAHSELMKSYFGRKSYNTIKIAMVLAASEGRYLVGAADLDAAKAMLEEIEPDMKSAFGLRAINKDEGAGGIIIKLIPFAPQRITKQELLQALESDGMLMPLNGDWASLLLSWKTSGSVNVAYDGDVESYSRTR